MIVLAGTSAYYTNSFYWAPLNPPVLLTNNTTYWLETETTSGYADWFGDSFVPTWNSWCVGSQATTTRWSTYGGRSATDTWPLTTGFTVLTKNGTYCVANMAYIPVGPPGVVVQQTGATIGSCQSSATNVVLNGYASGAATLGYQMARQRVPMSDGGLISGSSSATLTISTATSANAGTYYLVATNLLGTAQSANVPVVSDFGVPLHRRPIPPSLRVTPPNSTAPRSPFRPLLINGIATDSPLPAPPRALFPRLPKWRIMATSTPAA